MNKAAYLFLASAVLFCCSKAKSEFISLEENTVNEPSCQVKKEIGELKNFLIDVKNELLNEIKKETNAIWKYIKEETSLKKVLDESKLYRSCAELKRKTNVNSDGEYELHLKYPSCNKTVNVYCADMNSTSPKEYITLKAGEANNFAMKDYMNGPAQETKNSSKTLFNKIRINPDLRVLRDDFRFARIAWHYGHKNFVDYGSGDDCSSWTCHTPKKGKFKMDLTGTGLVFRTPIDWRYYGYPSNCGSVQPIDYSEVGRKVASGNCGAWCGGCYAYILQLDVERCDKKSNDKCIQEVLSKCYS